MNRGKLGSATASGAAESAIPESPAKSDRTAEQPLMASIPTSSNSANLIVERISTPSHLDLPPILRISDNEIVTACHRFPTGQLQPALLIADIVVKAPSPASMK
ncbi:MAG: hypothetical protein OXI30_03835 [Chloroflexota bacterium]|nr:hypothetical protein [Chloroflexota bacterium]